jgi:hypothetical protein
MLITGNGIRRTPDRCAIRRFRPVGGIGITSETAEQVEIYRRRFAESLDRMMRLQVFGDDSVQGPLQFPAAPAVGPGGPGGDEIDGGDPCLPIGEWAGEPEDWDDQAAEARETSHRRRAGYQPLFNVCVARPVGKREVASNAKAQAALDKGWSRLRSINCWDESAVGEWKGVARQARTYGQTVHRGRVFAICVEENADLPEDHPGRKYKGRVVFEGNYVHGQNWEAALLQELSSCPATMDAAKVPERVG